MDDARMQSKGIIKSWWGMNLEAKVGLFVLLGLVASGLSIMRLSDIRLEKTYTLYFIFDDVQGLREKSQIKIAGVEIGKADKIELEQGRAKITGRIQSDVPIYANAKVRIKLLGLIGTQFVDLNPGTPEAARLKDGDTLYGEASRSLNDLMEKLSDLIDGKDGKPGVGDDLRATMANLRSVTDALNSAIGLQRDELKDIVNNLNQFSLDLRGLASDLHEITSTRKADIDASLTKLRSILERMDELLAKVQRGEGSVGKLVSDKEMGEEVKKTVSHLKETAESAKDVLARFTRMRSFWEFQVRSAPGASVVRGDGGIRLQPREGKYYYVGVNNAGDGKNEYKSAGDFEKENTITAVLGKEFGPVTIEAGAIRSSAGIGLKYYPFKDVVKESEPMSWTRNIELNAQGFDFSRDEVRRNTDNVRNFNKPQFNIGAKYKVSRWLSLGAAVDDVAEIQQYNLTTHLVFEDRDLSYLFGFVSFAR